MKNNVRYQEVCAFLASRSFLSILLRFQHHFSLQRLLAFGLVFCVAEATRAQNLGSATHRVPQPIKFISPKPIQTITAESVKFEIQIAGDMDPATFKLKLNGTAVTGSFTSSSGCGSGLCEESGSLTAAEGIRHGWNYLQASVRNSNHAVGTANRKFYYKDGGLEDTSYNYALFPFDVPFSMAASGDVTIGYAQNQYQGSTTHRSYCQSTRLSVVVLDRTTLALQEQKCFSVSNLSQIAKYLSSLNDHTIVAVRGSAASSMSAFDMSSIGGTNFTLLGAPNANQYTAIGAGQGAPGTAYESFTTNGDNPPGINGVLENISSGETADSSSATGALYAFRTTDELGFTLSYTSSNVVQLETRYNLALPFNKSANVSNREIPQGQLFSQSWNSGSGAGILLWIFNRQNMQLAFGQVYNPATDPDAYTKLTQHLAALHTNGSAFASMDALVFIAFAQPQSYPMPQTQADLVSNLSHEIQFLGASATDFWTALTSGKRFALVGTPANSISVVPLGIFPAPGLPSSQIIPNNTVTTKPYSTEVDSQQNESGLLHGVLERSHQMLLTPAQVIPIPQTLAQQGDYLWERDTTYQVGNSNPVPWPFLQDGQHQKAYQWLSEILVEAAFDSKSPSQHTSSSCTDDSCVNVRYYYTGSQASSLFSAETAVKPDDASITAQYCKENDNVTCEPPNSSSGAAANCGAGLGKLGFSECDLADEQTQLKTEYDYVEYVQNYAATLSKLFAGSSSSIGSIIGNEASNLANNLVDNLPEGVPPPAQSKVSLASSILSDVSGGLSLFTALGGEATPLGGPAAILGGMLSLTSDILNTTSSIQAVQPTVDPYVVELSSLYASVNNGATGAEIYASQLSAAQDTFFTRVYSDWYRLQSLGLMAVNTDPQNPWYTAYTDATVAGSYDSLLTAGARGKFAIDVIPQQFVEDTYPGFANNYAETTANTPMQTQDIFNVCYGGKSPDTGSYATNTPTPSVFQNSNWLSETGDNNVSEIASLVAWPWNYALTHEYHINYEPQLPGMDVYVIRTIANAQNQFGYWSDEIGNGLMGVPNATDGTGPLNLNKNWFFENIIPKIQLGCPAGGGPSNFVSQ